MGILLLGDNDQGIYSFRGADITNILNLKRLSWNKNYKVRSKIIEYRNILKAANAVIKA